MDFVPRAKEVIEIEIGALHAVRERLDQVFNQVVELALTVLARRGKIVVSGVGKSGHVGRKIAATLTSTGAPAVVLDATDAVHGDLGVVSDGDLLLLFSYSGQTEELIRILPAVRRQELHVVVVTGAPHSTLGLQSDYCLDVSVPKEACPLNLAPTASTTAMMAMGDAFAMVLLEARGINKEDFAKFHPGGAIGRQLLLRVADVMRPLDQLALLPSSALVDDALQQWVEKKVGAAIVVEPESGRLAGIFTHGDFVRAFRANPRVAEALLKEVMTPRPITVRVDKLAVDVLNIFEHHRIDDLVVVDAEHKPVGLVDAQDMAKLKLV